MTARALRELVRYLDVRLRVAAYVDEGEPANGLLLDAGRPVTTVAVAVNTSLVTIARAHAVGAELLLVHHPPRYSFDRDLAEQKEDMLREAGMSLYAAHACLDIDAEFGSSHTLAARLGITIEGRLVPKDGRPAGVYGAAKEDSFDGFVERVRKLLGDGVEAHRGSDAFGRVAVVAGAGPWTPSLEAARQYGCDTYLTGEVTMYTRLYARETALNLIVADHEGTESFGIQALAEAVADRFALKWAFIPDEPELA